MLCLESMNKAFETTDGRHDYSELFSAMKPYFEQSDFVAANLETPITESDDLTDEETRFNTPIEFAEAAKESGIHFVATANNHCLDRDLNGLDTTIDCLNKVGLLHTGTFKTRDEERHTIVNVGGIRLGILSYTYGTNFHSNRVKLAKKDAWKVNLFQAQELNNPIERLLYDHQYNRWVKRIKRVAQKIYPDRYLYYPWERRQRCRTQMKRLRKDIANLQRQHVDLTIMFMHIGGQFRPQAVPYTKRMTDWLFRHGINIVVGSHEHVVQGIDFSLRKENKIGTYCLGNFDGTYGISQWTQKDFMCQYSIAWNVYVDKDENKNVHLVKTTYSILKSVSAGGGECTLSHATICINRFLLAKRKRIC